MQISGIHRQQIHAWEFAEGTPKSSCRLQIYLMAAAEAYLGCHERRCTGHGLEQAGSPRLVGGPLVVFVGLSWSDGAGRALVPPAAAEI